jgi:hypothetical protein
LVIRVPHTLYILAAAAIPKRFRPVTSSLCDLNTLPLRRYFTMDLMASHPLTPALDVFIAAENLLNQRYDIGRTPVLSVAPPILARVGLRLNLGGR